MTNAATRNEAAATRNEAAALDVLTMKGAQLRHAGFCAAVLPLALHAYKHGSDKEQWSGKGSPARPLRGAWAHVFTPATNGRLPADAAARAFRAVAQALMAELENKKRDTSDDACALLADTLETIVAGIIAPARAAVKKDETKAQADKLARAIRAIQDASVTLDDAAVDALRAVVAAHDAMRAASAASADKPSKPASTPTGDALTTAIADALTAAGIHETI